MPRDTARQAVERIYRAGLAAVDAEAAVRRAIERVGDSIRIRGRSIEPDQSLVVIAVGKAAAPMAAAAEDQLGDRIRDGLVVTKDGHARSHRLSKLRLREAAHPIPDRRCEAAAHELKRLVAETRREDLLLVLLSGGASALLSAPAGDFSLDELAQTNRVLLEGGVDIASMNVVRKHLSLLSGGRLAASTGAGRIEVLAISDVPGDREDVIASGPCSADPSRYADALAVLRSHGLIDRIPERVRLALEAGDRGELPETLEPLDPALSRVRYGVIARNRDACEAAGRAARAQGLRTEVVDPVFEGEAREVARTLLAHARANDEALPRCLIAGGESSVTVTGSGRGGRNQELALAAALVLESWHGPHDPEVLLLAAGTDGTDGPTDAAGAWADRETCARARRAGLDPEAALRENDSNGFFEAGGGAFHTGPTGTNVMDLVVIWIGSFPDSSIEQPAVVA